MSTNPLLHFSGLPNFTAIRADHIAPAMEHLLAEGRAVIARLLEDQAPPTWDNVIQPLADSNERLGRAWGQVSHLNAVMNSPELREAYNANLPKVSQYFAEMAQNIGLFKKVRTIRDSADYSSLSAPRKKVIENEVRDFRLGGAELPPEKKARFLTIQEEMSTLCSQYSDNILDATNAYTCLVEDEAALSGIPADERQVAAEAAQKKAAEGAQSTAQGWLFTLQAPSYGPLMQYADNRALRERMYIAYSTRASEQGKAELNNSPVMSQILKLRQEEAHLLGFANFAELSRPQKWPTHHSR